MKNTFNLFIFFVLFITACTSEQAKHVEDPVKQKGMEGPFVERYLKDMIANPTTRDEIERNIIVNYLIDNQLDYAKTDSGIYYKIDSPGAGGSPSLNSKITAHYRGFLLDGREFDSSYSRDTPLMFKLTQMIAGWQEVIPLLQKGGKGTFIIPSKLAYGMMPPRKTIIGKNEVLRFEIEVLTFR